MIAVWCARVPKENGEVIRQWLINHSLLNRDLKIQSEDGKLIFPLNKKPMDAEKVAITNLSENIDFEKREMELRESNLPKNLVTALRSKIPTELLKDIPKSFDIIGSLIIIAIPEELKLMKQLIGHSLMEVHP